MRSIRVLRIYHSAVVSEYRKRDRSLRDRHAYDAHLVCPPRWSEGSANVEPGVETGVPLHVVPVHGRREPNLFWYDKRALRNVVREVRPDIVDVHEEPYSLAVARILPIIASEAPDARLCVYTAQNLPKRYPPPFSLIEGRALSTAGAAYPCSTEAAQRLRNRGFRGTIHVIPLGVTIPDEIPRNMSDTFRVGYIGRLEAQKGAHIAVRAFAQAARGVNASLTIIGSGPQLASLKTEARQARVQDQVEFTGAISQDAVLKQLDLLDVVVIPSLTIRTWKEQFGRVAVQAMAHGAAVIASDSGSLREVVDYAGALVPEGDVVRFAQELRRLLDDPAHRNELISRGRARAVAEFSWDVVADKSHQMYQELLRQRT